MLEELTGTSLVRRFFLAILSSHSMRVLLLKQRTDLTDKSFMAVLEAIFLNGPDSVRCFHTGLSHTIPLSIISYRFDG